MQRMETLGQKIEHYVMETGKVPEAHSMNELGTQLMNRHDSNAVRELTDGWGKPLHYGGINIPLKDGRIETQYWLGSGGEKKFDGFIKYITKSGADKTEIVYSNGTFVANSTPEQP
ncbi:MAG: hypothetical protein GY765_23845 [bacterium]|nr:hypothetical protein [bacterium]